jgi:uncharacterized protein YdeI (YjbR/CyaY-like superfamily)
MKPRFFPTPDKWRGWLEKHHASTAELWVGFYKTNSGRPSITWPEAVDQALCFGWIDGVRKRLDEHSYVIRFTPRRPNSIWSRVNLGRVEELTRLGLMRPAGLEAHQGRNTSKSAAYSFEQRDKAALTPGMERRFKQNRDAWRYFQAQAPWYRRTTSWWVISAKKEETRERRLATLIEDCAQGRPIKGLIRP